MGANALIYKVVHVREWVEIMDCHFVEKPEVDAEVEGITILLDEVGFQNPIASQRNDITFGEHVDDDNIDLQSSLRGGG